MHGYNATARQRERSFVQTQIRHPCRAAPCYPTVLLTWRFRRKLDLDAGHNRQSKSRRVDYI